MNALFPDALLVSSVNGGGVFLIDPEGVVHRLSKIDTSGMARTHKGYLWARQSESSNELRVIRADGTSRFVLAPHPLDLHDLLSHDGKVHVAATQINAVLCLDGDSLHELKRWSFPGEEDAWHLNSLCIHDGKLLATRFGRFDGHRAYKGATAGAGEIFDVESGEVLVAGLSQPHSLRSHGGLLWVCDSETYSLRRYRDFREDGVLAFDGYTRGLAFGANSIYLGLSRSRNDPDSRLPRARLLNIDPVSMETRGTIELPCDEIYDVLPVSGPCSELLDARIHEAFEEIDSLRHARNLAIANGLAEHSKAIALAGELDHVRHQLKSLSATAASTAFRRQEEAAWRGMVEAEMARLEEALNGSGRDLAEAASFIDLILRSRSWRWTRPLRRQEPLRPLLPGQSVVDSSFEDVPSSSTEIAPRRQALPVLGLAFAEHAAPQVTIVVTSYGHFEQTYACLKAIQEAQSETTFEVMLVEDCSGDEDMPRFDTVPGLRYVGNTENLGFVRSVNRALPLARGGFIHLLNNDTLVHPGWLDALMRTFALLGDCGLAGSRLVYPDDTLQEAGGIVWSDGNACNYGRGDNPTRSRYGCVREVDYVSGASVLLRTELFRQLDGFDERYAPAYYEDTDLAYRVREAGHRVYLQPDSVVTHVEGLSHGTDPEQGGKRHQRDNRDRFLSLWSDVLQREQLSPGEHMFLARDRAQRRKVVLVVDHQVPRPDHDAGSRAMWQLMRVLYTRGFCVKFWSHGHDAGSGYADSLRRHGIEVLPLVDEAADFATWAAEHGRYLDYAILSRPNIAHQHVDAIRAHSLAKIVYYGHDIHFQRVERQAQVKQDTTLRSLARAQREVEEDVWCAVDLVLYPSNEETRHVREWLAEQDLRTAAETVPLFAFEGASPPVATSAQALRARRHLVFVGGYSHAPNEDAVLWFAREVWPKVRAHREGMRLVLIGADPPPAVQALSAPEIVVAGQVPEHELERHYREARVAIAPLRFGAGLKGKVIEAMHRGVPCVTTSVGAQGLQEADSLRVADTAQRMCEEILALFDDEAWIMASRAGQAFVADRFSTTTVWNALQGMMDPSPYRDVAERRTRISAAPGAGDLA